MTRPVALSTILLNALITLSASHAIEKRQSPPTTLPTGWSYKGCYTDSVGQRTLGSATGGDGATMSAATCIAFCNSRGYSLAGTEYSNECFCANTIGGAGAPATSGCSMPCNGAPGEACGGPDRLSVYEKAGGTGTPGPGPAPAGWGSLGCYSDSVAARILSTVGIVPGGPSAMTPELCAAACRQGNFKYAGTEYSAECFCGNTIQNGHTAQTGGCDMRCNGDTTKFCGGNGRINLYEFGLVVSSSSVAPPASTSASSSAPPPVSSSASSSAPPPASSSASSSAPPPASSSASPSAQPTAGWVSQGCYTDSVGQRSLRFGMGVTGGMTSAKCKTACRNAGYVLAGVEYAAECFCDNTVQTPGGPAPDGNVGCNMPCAGDSTEMCGGSNRLNLFRYVTGAVSSTSTPTTPSSTPISSVPSSTRTNTATATASGVPTGFAYKGCYVDGPGFRIMNNQQTDSNTMTIASCSRICANLGYTVAGMEYSTQCFCDNMLREDAALATADTQCNMACAGNTAEKCGGPNRLSVWSSQAVVKIVGKPKPLATVGDWTYQGCITDPQLPPGLNGWSKPFPWQLVNKTGNSPEWCLGECAKYGYMAAGMEYGEECYCGDLNGISKPNIETRPETECSMTCPGNPEAICGAGLRLTWYKWTGTPLYTFKYPTGNAAGRYQFLVGGPVIPLISQPSINGKVQFLEKKGTGPPNSTGAYEFDPSLSSNIFTTFRELQGIKTDIFCAAGLTMPDRKGRLINIGGWSLESTYGVRIMTPDGTLGTNGTSTWRENYPAVKLQKGRWYPTGMVMANGSMLIVGGQDGSNGAPVPSLEILPPAGGVKELEFLRRTDPYNLYPYLVVLPSGGIFIQYYNEARVLSEDTLDVIKTLPNAPASVNNPRGGRTYPYEGTQVLLPQRAPYTAPLEVLICGGATPNPNWGIDNCVSIQPDAPNPKWVIERMPSRRVMSCMASLPDGTYLIMNGAETGEAGFGLAENENLNAVLYDANAPVNQRMSIMANTTIPRMYHSEAVLMDDGRVLVSGSDPQDPGDYDQEYRLEVFLPPYLLGGAVKPVVSIANKDWSHGGSYQVQIASSAGAITRITLLGSESSTHGSSMGARTIFPAFSCAGNVCTVTAPPNRYVAPPGWYRVFVMDGGKNPSMAIWVRIGGDPANLGNWPSDPTFAPLPGVGPL